ncbi:hypothetical protein LJB92_02180 [Bacteroidales bacterium OttesenSCG-928-M06]|nr:hypothetical protein [Bacteroidales bacterium OttesenSCG-928-M06]
MNIKNILSIILFLGIVLSACNSSPDSYDSLKQDANIYPQYEGTVIPYNIAPLNFRIQEDGDKYFVRFVVQGEDSFDITTKKDVQIPLKKWKKLLKNNNGKNILVKIFSHKENKWIKYNDIEFTIANDPVDPYMAYRLIEPGYNAWNKMGLYQRCLETFEEKPIIENSLTDKNCMNCHTFHKHNPELMVFHMRGKNGGTILTKNEEIKKIDTKAPWMVGAGVYPRWHPEARYIAFSTNKTFQIFHSLDSNKIEVFDLESDLIIYDTERDRIFTDSIFHSKNSYETFPEWSADGKFLYFCTAPAIEMPYNYDKIRYSLVRVAFDPANEVFSNEVDTLISAYQTGKSVSIPRISPDGKKLVFCMFDYGTFPIWHKENDLYELDLESKEITELAILNSKESDSFHSWSSNGRWMLFSSRRIDGTYTRPYIAYRDDTGKWHKPFLVPQKQPDYYDFLMKSYNVPEFITGEIKISPNKFEEVGKSKAVVPISK